eukprot:1184540-Prorocentrum_minimum.AAC.1
MSAAMAAVLVPSACLAPNIHTIAPTIHTVAPTIHTCECSMSAAMAAVLAPSACSTASNRSPACTYLARRSPRSASASATAASRCAT